MKPAPPVTSARFTASNPAVTASRWNICTVSSENCSRSLPSVPSLASTSLVQVMMWQPIASAWTTLSSSRGLAQISSAPARRA